MVFNTMQLLLLSTITMCYYLSAAYLTTLVAAFGAVGSMLHSLF